jgi:hypothetical protein
MLKHPARPSRFRHLPKNLWLTLIALFVFNAASLAHADDKPSPDTLVFSNGDSLKGKLIGANGSGVTFHSDMAGDLTITWDKIKTIDATEKFAVIKNKQLINRKTPPADVPQGTIAVSDKNVNVAAPNGPATVSVSDTQAIVEDGAFQNTVYHEPGFFNGYVGAFTLGVALVDSTQTAQTFNGALNLVRTVPNASWIDPRNKTILDAAGIYGLQKQNANPAQGTLYSSVKTVIIHGDLERDEYLTPRFYYLGYASADHNYAQGLSLQYIFGGGFGYTVIKDPVQELDVKTDLHYERQEFATPLFPVLPTPSNNLIGMDFAETYMRKLPKGLGFTETGVFTPSFNTPSATIAVANPGHPYSADFNAAVTFPVYKQLSFSSGLIDNYISNPAPGFNSNSFQFIFGATYAFK